VERDKAVLARNLHDNTGGLLVAAIMDITWSETHLPGNATLVRERLVRARAALDAAIDLNRRMIEDLRPTLLDNFGLFAALKWHFAGVCKSANILCEHYLPDPSPNFSPAAAIALYRIAQTLTEVMVSHHAHAIVMRLTVDPEFVTLHMHGDGFPNWFTGNDETTSAALASVTGRVKGFGGDVQFDAPLGGAADIACRLRSTRSLTRDEISTYGKESPFRDRRLRRRGAQASFSTFCRHCS
jgi:signal transduction histidine kinase